MFFHTHISACKLRFDTLCNTVKAAWDYLCHNKQFYFLFFYISSLKIACKNKHLQVQQKGFVFTTLLLQAIDFFHISTSISPRNTIFSSWNGSNSCHTAPQRHPHTDGNGRKWGSNVIFARHFTFTEDFHRGKSWSPNSGVTGIHMQIIYTLICDFESRKTASGDTVTYSFDICPATMSTCSLSHKAFQHNTS